MTTSESLVSVKQYLNEYGKSDLSEVAFSSGLDQVDNYLKQDAYYDFINNVAQTNLFIIEFEIVGYYTVAVGSLDLEPITNDSLSIMSKYLPVLFLHELGVDKQHQGNGYGTSLLFDVFKKTVRISHELQIGIGGVLIHSNPKDEVIKFYFKYGFLFVNRQDEIDFGLTEYSEDIDYNDLGFVVPRQNSVQMFIPIKKIEEHLALYEL